MDCCFGLRLPCPLLLFLLFVVVPFGHGEIGKLPASAFNRFGGSIKKSPPPAPPPPPKSALAQPHKTITEEVTWKRKTRKHVRKKAEHPAPAEKRTLTLKGLIWPLSNNYSIRLNIAGNEKIAPVETKTGPDGLFEAVVSLDKTAEDPKNVELTISGGVKEWKDEEFPLEEVEWDKFYVIDLEDQPEESWDMFPSLSEALEEMEQRHPAEQEKVKRLFRGIVWPVGGAGGGPYRMFVATGGEFVMKEEGKWEKGPDHPEPVEAAFHENGTFEAELMLLEHPSQLRVAVQRKGHATAHYFTVEGPNFDKFYALDIRTNEQTRFNNLEEILEELKKKGMDTRTVKRQKAAPPPPPAPPASEHELLTAIRAMVAAKGAELEAMVEQEHVLLRTDLERELKQKVGPRMEAIAQGMEQLGKGLSALEGQLEKGLVQAVASPFAALADQKLVLAWA